MPLDAPAAAPFSLETLGPAFAVALGEDAGASPPQTAFLARVLEDFRPDELPTVRLDDLAEVLAGFWRFGAEAKGAPAVRLRGAEGAGDRDLGVDVLEIVQPDAPFLVDSVMGEVGESGAEVRAMFHPMVGEGEARISMIEVWLAPMAHDRHVKLVERVSAAVADVHAAVDDTGAMLGLMKECIDDLAAEGPHASPAIEAKVLAEDLAFLRWMGEGNFILLGARTYDYPRTADGGYAPEEPSFAPDGGLGLLRDPARTVLRRVNEPAVLAALLKRRLETAAPVVVAKSNLRSRVHRRAYMDYVGIRRIGPKGEPIGETRFVGLFTAQAYDEPAEDIPLVRRKLAQVIETAGFASGSHNALRLANILEAYPRDELFQISAAELLTISLDILHLFDRPKVKLFTRYDPFDRFVSVLLFAPRERYDEHLRERAGALLAEAFGGRVSAYYPSYSDTPLARVHYIIGLTPGAHANPDLVALEAEVTKLARTWEDDLEAAVRGELADPADAPRLLAAWRDAFPAGYRDRYDGAEALYDILAVEALTGEGAVSVRAFRAAGDTARQFHFEALSERRRAGPALAGAADPRRHGPQRLGGGWLSHPPARTLRRPRLRLGA